MYTYKNVWAWLSSQLGGNRKASHVKAFVLGGCGGTVPRRGTLARNSRGHGRSGGGSDSDSDSDSGSGSGCEGGSESETDA